MPRNDAKRVVEGAQKLSPFLGERMFATCLLGRDVFIRELMPQDLKLELDQISRSEATEAARFLAMVVGKAHGRQMGPHGSKTPGLASCCTIVARHQTKSAYY